MSIQKVVRNARTGRFSKSKKAQSAPATHVTETISIPRKKNKKPVKKNK